MYDNQVSLLLPGLPPVDPLYWLLAAASAGWEYALYTLPGPLFLTFTLTKWSGVTLLEKGMDLLLRHPDLSDVLFVSAEQRVRIE